MEESLHFFCFSFTGDALANGRSCKACTFIGRGDRIITMKTIQEAKHSSGVCADAVLISVSYLGFMTEAEFKGTD